MVNPEVIDYDSVRVCFTLHRTTEYEHHEVALTKQRS